MTWLTGFLIGIGIVIILWLFVRRADKKYHARKMELLQERIKQREEALKSKEVKSSEEEYEIHPSDKTT